MKNKIKNKLKNIDFVKLLKRVTVVGLLVAAVIVFSEGCGAVEEMDIWPSSSIGAQPEVDSN